MDYIVNCMNYEGAVRANKATTRVLRERKNSDNSLQLKKKLNYVVIWQENKGGGREGAYNRYRRNITISS